MRARVLEGGAGACTRWILCVWTVWSGALDSVLAGPALAAEQVPYPHSLEEEIRSLVAAGADQSTDPVFLIALSALYLDAGDNLYKETKRRRRAYEEGARLAKRALEIQEVDPEAHYLYAANLGSAAELEGLVASALTVGTLKRHVRRAIELDPEHVGALHMMGMLLEELPAVLGGDAEQALGYLERAVQLDPQYSHARLHLAKAYLARQRRAEAERQLQAIVEMQNPRNPYTWSRRHKPEAQELLGTLRKGRSSSFLLAPPERFDSPMPVEYK